MILKKKIDKITVVQKKLEKNSHLPTKVMCRGGDTQDKILKVEEEI
ncbi:MAG: hypothetical protein HUJ51_03815 [Eggerthellaceae bacterium]|nr:hypothetical protein [Eggerthellaceae bacterium]